VGRQATKAMREHSDLVRGFQRRVREAIKAQGVSVWKFTKRGFPKGTLGAWLAEKRPRLPFTEPLLTFADKAGCDVGWLVAGQESAGGPFPAHRRLRLYLRRQLAALGERPESVERIPHGEALLDYLTDLVREDLDKRRKQYSIEETIIRGAKDPAECRRLIEAFKKLRAYRIQRAIGPS
jgi:hypothetical protein